MKRIFEITKLQTKTRKEMSGDMYEVILKDDDGEELHVETMDISGKSVGGLLKEMLELWRENQDTGAFSIEVTKVKK